VSEQLREASSVILLRRKPAGFEVFLLRRRKGASFMASAYVFPGGIAEGTEDARAAAARELFEEAGILLAKTKPVEPGDNEVETLEMPSLATIRKRILAGADARKTLGAIGLEWATDTLVPWAHWITPSAEASLGASTKRYSARFFACELPPGQEPKFDDVETVDQVWVRPADAIARAKELALPPPQIRMCWELAELATVDEVLKAGRVRAEEPHPIMPRLRTMVAGDPPCLLLPWDPEYTETGSGDAAPLTYRPNWARGPSRFVMEDQTWKHIAAPGSTKPAS
jgi:8-oxo-dGTP pyrophosphatase MutT (NUDIX family)